MTLSSTSGAGGLIHLPLLSGLFSKPSGVDDGSAISGKALKKKKS
jgi:hypothetical protein